MKKIVLIFIAVIALSCGGSDDSGAPMQQNRNPGSFTITTDNITQNEATITWTAAIDPDGDMVTYAVTLDGTSVVSNLTATNYTLTNLSDATQYNGIVTANDGNGGTSTSNYTLSTLQNTATTISFNIPSELQNYYGDMTFYENATQLKDALATHVISNHTTFLEYGERHNYLYDADEDANNTANVILMYSGESRDEREYESGNNSHSPQTFNTEHVYPRSLLSGTSEADLHHLRVCDRTINGNRKAYPFVDGTGGYQLINNNAWYPGDDWKGDVARMIMYLNLRYDESFTDVGNLELFLKWNREDPVSDFERQRNNVIQNPQGNRNPFIDNPYLATLIWGGESAENSWK